MRNRLVATYFSVAMLGGVPLALAGTYGEPEQAEEAPKPIQMAPESEPAEGWRFFVTPQIWGSRIESNGFASPSGLGRFVVTEGDNVVDPEPFNVGNSHPVDTLDVQWGVQIAAAKGRWSFAASFQTVDFETRSNVVLDSPGVSGIPDGSTVAQEYLNTTRYDFDFAATYAFPRVLERLDMSVGAGLKAMNASSVHQYANVNAELNMIVPGGLFQVCNSGGCSDESRVKTSNWTYGVVIPVVANIHVTDEDWRLPISVTPFLGLATRDDQGLVVDYDYDPDTQVLTPNDSDGTSFAWGGTIEGSLRHKLADNLWAYTGMRVQYIAMDSSSDYLAWGPVAGIQASFTMD